MPRICELLDSPTLQALAAEIDAILDEPLPGEETQEAQPVTVPAAYRAQLAGDIPECSPVERTREERSAEAHVNDIARLMRRNGGGPLGSEV